MGCVYAQNLSFWVLGKQGQVGSRTLGVHTSQECFTATKLGCLNIISFESRPGLRAQGKLGTAVDLPNKGEMIIHEYTKISNSDKSYGEKQ